MDGWNNAVGCKPALLSDVAGVAAAMAVTSKYYKNT